MQHLRTNLGTHFKLHSNHGYPQTQLCPKRPIKKNIYLFDFALLVWYPPLLQSPPLHRHLLGVQGSLFIGCQTQNHVVMVNWHRPYRKSISLPKQQGPNKLPAVWAQYGMVFHLAERKSNFGCLDYLCISVSSVYSKHNFVLHEVLAWIEWARFQPANILRMENKHNTKHANLNRHFLIDWTCATLMYGCRICVWL